MKESLTQALLMSFVRKLVTSIATALVTYGWIDADLSNRLTTEAVTAITAGIIGLVASFWLSYKNVILEFVKTRVGIAMPPNASLTDVSIAASLVEDKKSVALHGISTNEVNNATKTK